MTRETAVNTVILGLLIAVPAWALYADEPFTITLATRAVIFALAAAILFASFASPDVACLNAAAGDGSARSPLPVPPPL